MDWTHLLFVVFSTAISIAFIEIYYLKKDTRDLKLEFFQLKNDLSKRGKN